MRRRLRSRQLRQLRHNLDRDHLARQRAQHRGRVAATGADFEHRLVPGEAPGTAAISAVI